jgi:hypothetical protein
MCVGPQQLARRGMPKIGIDLSYVKKAAAHPTKPALQGTLK